MAIILPTIITGYGFYTDGPCKITGTITGVSGSRVTRLYSRYTGRLLRQVTSAANGDFAFRYVANENYYVIAYDHENVFSTLASWDMPTLLDDV